MNRTIIAALLCTLGTMAYANPPVKTNPQYPSNYPISRPVQNTTTNTTNTNSAVGIGYGAAESNSSVATLTSVGMSTGAVTSNVNVEASRLAQAPDVISYPTAPCRISIGASGGWFGGAIGFSGSSLDEACSRIETSRHLHNLGAKEAAVQIMCLSSEAKQALEATGVKCLIKAEAPAERVTP